MKGSSNHISFIFSRILLLGVYAAFFLVQLVNAYLNENNSTPSFENFISAKSNSKKSLAFSIKSKETQRSTIRLNKRFHPESIISIGYVSIQPPMRLIGKKVMVKPQDYLLISSILTDSLRGPPAVV